MLFWFGLSIGLLAGWLAGVVWCAWVIAHGDNDDGYGG